MYYRTQFGFSLVETLVAITILLIVVVGPMTIISSATSSTNFSSEQVVANFLAQEGAELAQKARDDLLLPQFLPMATPPPADAAWDSFTDRTSPAAQFRQCFNGGCGLEYSASTKAQRDTGALLVANCVGAGNVDNCRLNIDTTSARRSHYTHDAGTRPSPFTRVITMNHDPARPFEVEVVSTVTWQTGDQRRQQQAQVRTYLYNVYGR